MIARLMSLVAYTVGVLALQGAIAAQVIDFESLPGGAPVTSGMVITDQYAVVPYRVTFSLVGADSTVGPRIADVGAPRTAFRGPVASNPCISGTSDEDMPASGESVGCFFLTDDGVLSGSAYTLRVAYLDPTYEASGVLLDVDEDEGWTIQALRADSSLILEQRIVDGETDTGDGVATEWSLTSPEAIFFIDFIPDIVPGHNFGVAFDSFTPSSLASDLAVDKVGPVGPVAIGDTLVYNLTVTNDGPGDATDVSVQDFLPAGVTYVSHTTSQGSCFELNGVVTCELGTVANGAGVAIEIKGVLEEWVLVNTATATAVEYDPHPSNNADSATTSALAAVREPTVERSSISLERNRPNPFGKKTTISFKVAHPTHVEVSVYDVVGRRVATLVDERREVGAYDVEWNGRDATGRKVGSGVYYLTVEAGGRPHTKKMVVLR